MLKFHHAPGEQTQGPPSTSVRRCRAGHGNQVGLLRAIQLRAIDPAALAIRAQRRGQALLDKALPQALDRGEADPVGLGDLLVRPSRGALGLVRLQQYTGMLELADIRLAASKQPAELLPLRRRQRYSIPLHQTSSISRNWTNGSGHAADHG